MLLFCSVTSVVTLQKDQGPRPHQHQIVWGLESLYLLANLALPNHRSVCSSVCIIIRYRNSKICNGMIAPGKRTSGRGKIGSSIGLSACASPDAVHLIMVCCLDPYSFKQALILLCILQHSCLPIVKLHQKADSSLSQVPYIPPSGQMHSCC
jgi:hypothetical protein